MSARKLIVHADDFGRSVQVTEGIARAFHEGIVSSTSIVAQGIAFTHAVKVAQETPNLEVGIHLCLDEYAPMLAQMPTAWRNSDGAFPPRAATLRRLFFSNPNVIAEIEREWDAQISKCLDAGLRLSHIDGHGHCHIHPALVSTVRALGQRYAIRAVRVPRENFWYRGSRATPARFAQKAILNLCCRYARRVWKTTFRMPDHFFGFMAGGSLEAREVEIILTQLGEGVNELMVHVGISDSDPYGLPYRWRSADFAAVTHWNKAQLRAEFGVELCAYANAWEH